MFELNDSGATPPCGWSYTIDETRVTVFGEGFDDLVSGVKKNLDLNGIKHNTAILSATIMDDLCRRSPSGICKGFTNLFITRPRDVMNGTTALSIMLRRKAGAFVSSEVAEQRAAICAECRYNVDNPGCIVCKGFKSIIDRAKRGRITSKDGELNTCGICRCFLQALVHVDVGILRATTPKNHYKVYPKYCWKRKELTGEAK